MDEINLESDANTEENFSDYINSDIHITNADVSNNASKSQVERDKIAKGSSHLSAENEISRTFITEENTLDTTEMLKAMHDLAIKPLPGITTDMCNNSNSNAVR